MKKWLVSDTITHVVGWILFISLPVIFIVGQQGGPAQINLLHWLLLSIYIVFFYVHAYWMYPRLLLAKKYALYGLLMLFLLLLVTWLQPFEQLVSNHLPMDWSRALPGEHGPRMPFPVPNERPRKAPQFDVVSIALFILVMAMSMAYATEKRRRQAVQQALEAMADKKEAELALLKAQINPHFLFNTLNNIYSLALMKDDQTPNSILQFSGIMRYVTDEASAQWVSLEAEVQCMQDYIQLQQLRLTEHTNVSYDIRGSLDSCTIAPLILMTFIENSFKFGVSNTIPTSIEISLEVTADFIHFRCANAIIPHPALQASPGIGISNTRKRLQYLYPNRHQLHIEASDQHYIMNLHIQPH